MTVDDVSTLSFEAALKRLETIVHSLESGAASLEDSIRLYGQGQALQAHCEAKLKQATAQIEAIAQSDDGSAMGTRPLDGAGQA